MKQVAEITRFFSDAKNFLIEVKNEMAKVVWPKTDELVGSTVVVLILVAAFTIYLGSVDFVLARVTEWIFLKYGMQ